MEIRSHAFGELQSPDKLIAVQLLSGGVLESRRVWFIEATVGGPARMFAPQRCDRHVTN